jgi:hypothetical protein
MTNAVKYFDEMMAVPGVSNYLTDLSYHRYGGVSDAALQDIAARAKQYGVRTGMLELINAGYEDLHQDLKIGLNSEWEQYGLSGCVVYSPTSGGPHITVSQVNPTVVIYNNRTRYLMQYFKYVRRGAVRIDATSKISVLDPLAWVNTNGRFVVVVKATDAQSFSVGGLPPGRYGIFYTIGPNDETFTEANVNLPDVELGSSQALTTGIPGKGIITVYAK